MGRRHRQAELGGAITIALPYWDDERGNDEPTLDAIQTIASLWAKQVEAYDSLRRPSWPRRYVKFSPSQADNCLRELFYVNTNAPQDTTTAVAWKERRRRNGDAYHAETQKAYMAMVEDLRKAGVDVNFELVAMEIAGSETYRVELDGTKYDVRIEGRCDLLLRYVGEAIPGVIATGDIVLLDWKSKDKLSGVSGVQRRGVPSYTTAQMSAYSLLTFDTKNARWATTEAVYRDLDIAIIHYESLQKMKEDTQESKDVYSVVVRATDDDQRRLLVRFAKVVEAIEKGVVPDGDFTKCNFCQFAKACSEYEKSKVIANR